MGDILLYMKKRLCRAYLLISTEIFINGDWYKFLSRVVTSGLNLNIISSTIDKVLCIKGENNCNFSKVFKIIMQLSGCTRMTSFTNNLMILKITTLRKIKILSFFLYVSSYIEWLLNIFKSTTKIVITVLLSGELLLNSRTTWWPKHV